MILLFIHCPRCHRRWGICRQSEAQLPLLFFLWKEWFPESVNPGVFLILSCQTQTRREKTTSTKRAVKEVENKPNLDFCLQDNWQTTTLPWLQNSSLDHRWLDFTGEEAKLSPLQPPHLMCAWAGDPGATLCWTINQWYLLYLCTIFHATKQHLHLGSICLKLKCSCYISSASKVWC